MNRFQLPKDFLFGTATASLQIEGGDTNNNWYRFCEQNKTKDGTHCIVAADHWNKYEEDIDLMKQLHQDTYRMSVEWSRIEPERGRFDEAALDHYRTEISLLLEKGIHPLVTLHHFSNPIWFEDMGGWANQDAVLWFDMFVRKVVYTLGDLVEDWVTINEPNVYLEGTYSAGNYPPNKPNFINYFKGAKNMISAHIRAYKTIHEIRREQGYSKKTMVGVAHHLRVFDTATRSTGGKVAANMMDHVFHHIFLEGMTYGKFVFPIGHGHYPYGEKTFCDFMGINYYSRDIVRFSWNPLRLFGELTVKDGTATNDLGWEIYPDGLYKVCKRCWEYYPFPIYITENGICDKDDKQRGKFIYDHLKVIKQLIDEGVPVERYYHWSLIDNFEWDEGLGPKFGLIEVNYDTQKRTIRKSGKFYGEVSEAGAVTDDIISKYSFLQEP